MEMLSIGAIDAALLKLPDWKRTTAGEATAIQRDYKFANFVKAMEFVNQVAEKAEAAGHHPDIAISYNRVTLTITTHDAGGVTVKDIELAEKL
jgi:4a-hydroxytetrahydrobiopterin dehydratase